MFAAQNSGRAKNQDVFLDNGRLGKVCLGLQLQYRRVIGDNHVRAGQKPHVSDAVPVFYEDFLLQIIGKSRPIFSFQERKKPIIYKEEYTNTYED